MHGLDKKGFITGDLKDITIKSETTQPKAPVCSVLHPSPYRYLQLPFGIAVSSRKRSQFEVSG